MRALGRFVVGMLAAVGGLVVLSLLVVVAMIAFAPDGPADLPDRMVLRLNLGDIEDRRRSDAFFLDEQDLVLREVVLGLDAASRDERVAGLAVHMGGFRADLATVQELRAAVAGFRAAGKPARLFTEDLGGLGGGTAGYYLASAFDEIWVQPSGGVGLIGLAIEVPFAGGMLEKLEVEPRFGQRHEYKSAVESMTRAGMSDPARENLQALLESLFGQIVTGVAVDRGMGESQVRDLVDRGPFLASQALEAGLIDRIGYWDEFIDEIAAVDGDDIERVFLEDYLAAIDPPNADGPKVALVYGSGAISMGSADDGNGFSGGGFGAHSVARAIADAIEDEEIEAILFRIDSPGGSYVASDIVWREVRRAREAGKPVVVSMGGTAASGGYFVAMGADRLIAQPATVTGSIGVYGGKYVTEKLWERFGIAWEELHVGENAGMWSFVRDFPAGAEQRFAEMLDFIYADFTGKAMEDRALSQADMDRVARGRVWTGADALEKGLVDGLGGYLTAIAAVKEALELAQEDEIELMLWPPPKDRFAEALRLLRGGRDPLAGMVSLFGGGEQRGLTDALGAELGLPPGTLDGLRPPAGVLQMPPIALRY